MKIVYQNVLGVKENGYSLKLHYKDSIVLINESDNIQHLFDNDPGICNS